ncbi:hypothetical protein DPMN_029634 [Dreissena polymorpha]|uniref:Uncharacterized protein n=1 Tax=Dreissena polymorpha TaxID=45954 RepID=A0A9D4RHK1_DREPO|nr:hypothetical protein DPMN_029634 [Dreissena polymorpha]
MSRSPASDHGTTSSLSFFLDDTLEEQLLLKVNLCFIRLRLRELRFSASVVPVQFQPAWRGFFLEQLLHTHFPSCSSPSASSLRTLS